VRIDAHTPESATVQLLRSKAQDPGRAVHLCNAYTLSIAARDDAYRRRLNNAALNLPDGMPLVWLGRRLGLDHMARRVYGPDLLLATVDRGRPDGLRHYLYGATDHVLDRMEAALRRDYPGVELVGREAPPFRPLDDGERRATARRMEAARPDVVWVGLGTPRQDDFLHQMRHLVPATLVAVGAAFDFVAGTKAQAPAWMQDRGLEWGYRLAHEPRRLWRRYLIGNAVFAANVARGGFDLQAPAER
jgi:N-acetylglucosaminyldiphosphoundecaprenol N-acetyl-beta-D-mannosaminyltransferase